MSVLERPVEKWVERVRAEYLEMPGLSLTRPQIRRLWRLNEALCDAVVGTLVASHFLRLRPDHTYALDSNDV
jgi:hypothetical protein